MEPLLSSYLFGKESKLEISVGNAEMIVREARIRKNVFAETPVDQIIHVISQVGQLWQPGGKYAVKALSILQEELSFSKETIQATLDIIPLLCDKESLMQRIQAEIGSLDYLDQFSKHFPFEGRVRAYPHGVLLHVAAGNVFIGCIDSLLNGFLTKNVSLLKLSERNQQFPNLFAESIFEADTQKIISDKFSLIYWPYEKHEIESIFKRQVDAIVAWGGEDMLKSYRQGRGLQTKLFEHGPKISFQVIFAEALACENTKQICAKIVSDVAMWDQSACSSAQNLFLQEGIDIDGFMRELATAFDQFKFPRGILSTDEAVELLKEDYRGLYSESIDGGKFIKGNTWALHFDVNPNLRSSPLNRTLIIKKFKNLNDLENQISPFRDFLQTCGYLVPENLKEQFLSKAAAWGIPRLTAIGQMTEGPLGAPHDGGYLLGELIRWVADEVKTENLANENEFISFAKSAVQRTATYSAIYKNKKIESFKDLIPVLSKDIFSRSTLKTDQLMKGHVFLSGGTTGQPKTVFYSNSEFDVTAGLLAKGFKSQGIGPGDVCANLFVAGGMWSSFLAVNKALEKCEVLQLPIGGQTDIASIVDYLVQFKPKVLLGLPSLMISILNYCINKNVHLEIPKICYAGEHLANTWRKEFKKHWNTDYFLSAGYASVDAGPIGYQCQFAANKEHHLFSSKVHLEIINGEAVVTSMIRRQDPIISLRTGDMIEWSSSNLCQCGSLDPKFILLGRCDRQINIWGIRLYIDDIEQIIEELDIKAQTFQIVVENVTDTKSTNHRLKERLSLFIESETNLGSEQINELKTFFISTLMQKNLDLKAHSSVELITQLTVDFDIKFVRIGTIGRSIRTGKSALVKDLRN